MALLVRLRRTNELRALLASGIAFELAVAWHGGGDWRESLWLIASTLLALALAIARRAVTPAVVERINRRLAWALLSTGKAYEPMRAPTAAAT